MTTKRMFRFTAAALACALATALAASCSGDDSAGGGGSAKTSTGGDTGRAAAAGLMPEGDWQARSDDYIAYATQELSPGSPNNVMLNLERRRRDPSFEVDTASVVPAAFADMFAEIDVMADTTDFDLMYLLALWFDYRDELPAPTVKAIEDHFLAFKFWYTEPQKSNAVDNKWYWSENHRIIFHMLEYLIGTAFPDATFTSSGMTGSEHVEHAKPLIEEWLAERARFGFFEWHSDVYYLKDVSPLLMLIEHADDADIAKRATMVLDLTFLDVALHLQNGAFGATHGRSYMKDKYNGTQADTFGFQKFLFDDTDLPYTSESDAGPTGLALATKYRLPEVIRRIATSDQVGVDEERMGVALDPLAPLDSPTPPPDGYSYDNPDDVPFWWSMAAHTSWPVVPITLKIADKYKLWDTEGWKDFTGLRDMTGGDPEVGKQLAQSLGRMVAFELLAEVNTYTWRSPDVMLSTAQDYRPGDYGGQYHPWQATIDPDAFVFATGPTSDVNKSPNLEWSDGDGYWTGGVQPRSAQYERVGIHLYAPQYESPTGPPLDSFAYEPYTHAFFPREHFDEVVEKGHWTIGRKGDGYVALYSWRNTRWQAYDPAVLAQRDFTDTFDLVADGGSDNVWMVEVGQAADWESFDAFVTAITAAKVDVTPLGTDGAISKGFDVAYESPQEGAVSFGWSKPLTVDGSEVAIHDYPRMDNPWTHVEHGSLQYDVKDGGYGLALDFEEGTRTVSGG